MSQNIRQYFPKPAPASNEPNQPSSPKPRFVIPSSLLESTVLVPSQSSPAHQNSAKFPTPYMDPSSLVISPPKGPLAVSSPLQSSFISPVVVQPPKPGSVMVSIPSQAFSPYSESKAEGNKQLGMGDFVVPTAPKPSWLINYRSSPKVPVSSHVEWDNKEDEGFKLPLPLTREEQEVQEVASPPLNRVPASKKLSGAETQAKSLAEKQKELDQTEREAMEQQKIQKQEQQARDERSREAEKEERLKQQQKIREEFQRHEKAREQRQKEEKERAKEQQRLKEAREQKAEEERQIQEAQQKDAEKAKTKQAGEGDRLAVLTSMIANNRPIASKATKPSSKVQSNDKRKWEAEADKESVAPNTDRAPKRTKKEMKKSSEENPEVSAEILKQISSFFTAKKEAEKYAKKVAEAKSKLREAKSELDRLLLQSPSMSDYVKSIIEGDSSDDSAEERDKEKPSEANVEPKEVRVQAKAKAEPEVKPKESPKLVEQPVVRAIPKQPIPKKDSKEPAPKVQPPPPPPPEEPEDKSSASSADEMETEEAPKQEEGVDFQFFRTSPKSRVLLQTTSEYITAHGKKLRTLHINKSSPDLLATTSMDGTLKFWHYQRGGNVTDKGTMDKRVLRTSSYPQTMAWNNVGSHCAVVFPTSSDETSKQMIVIKTDGLPKVQTRFIESRPHSKDIQCVEFIPKVNDKLITGGADHKVILWDIGKKKSDTSVLHSVHTSGVWTCCCHPNGELVFTGGADKRVIIWSLETMKQQELHKMTEKVNCIKVNPKNPDIALISMTAQANQLVLFDLRTSKFPMMLGWKHSASSPSQYIQPDWSPCGTLVACGNTEPLVNIWDMRYQKAGQPSQSLQIHEKRVIQSLFHPTTDCLITASSDRQLGFHTFSLGYSD